MKEKILEKIQILRKVTVDSYFVPDGNDYQGICDEVRDMMDSGYYSGTISEEDYREICKELVSTALYVKSVKDQAVKKSLEMASNPNLN